MFLFYALDLGEVYQDLELFILLNSFRGAAEPKVPLARRYIRRTAGSATIVMYM